MKENKYISHEPSSRFPVGVDLDSTVAKRIWPTPGIGEPLEGAKEAIEELRKDNQVVIFTARAWHERRTVYRWLFDHGIKVDDVLLGKPSLKAYIGDEAVAFRGDWDKTLKDTRKLIKG